MYPTPPNVSLYFAERVKAWVICPLPQPSESSHVRPQATHGVAIEVPHHSRLIGEELFGSAATGKRHLANVYEKVGGAPGTRPSGSPWSSSRSASTR